MTTIEVFKQLQPGMKVQVVSRLYGTRTLTVTAACAASPTVPHIEYVYTSSGKTLRETMRGGSLRLDTTDSSMLYQPTWTQQVCEVLSLEIV